MDAEVTSVSGEPIQRLGAYMPEGQVLLYLQGWKEIKEHASCAELLSYIHLLYQVWVYICLQMGLLILR
jgi:hypothetical protein